MAVHVTIRYTDPLSDPLKKQPFTLLPGEQNTNATSLSLMGQGVANYAQYLNDDLIRLLEHFASSSPPLHPTVGQIWFDAGSSNVAKVYRKLTSGAYEWSPLGGVIVSPNPPTEHGALWYDTSNPDPLHYQLKIYNAGAGTWLSVADRYILKTGDTITGSIKTDLLNVGLTNSGGTTFITPASTHGIALSTPASNVVVVNNSSAVANGSYFAVGAHSLDVGTAVDSARRLFSVIDTGSVVIHRGTLSLSGNKILNVAPGTVSQDAVNFQQLVDTRASLQAAIDAISTNVGSVEGTLSNKVSKTGDTMSGGLVINNALSVTGISSLSGGLAVIGTANVNGALFANSCGIAGAVSVGDSMSVIGATTMYSSLQVNGQITALGHLSGQTMQLAGAGVINGPFFAANTAHFNNTLTAEGLIYINQPASAIVQQRHATTKEYVDSKIQAIPIPPAVVGLWVGKTTLANIAATYADPTAYPPGTVIAFDTDYSTPYGYGNGTAYATYTTRCTAIRTTNAGWVLGTANYVDQELGVRMFATE